MIFEWVKWKRNPKNLLLLGILLLSLVVQLTNQWDRSTRIGTEDYDVLKAMADEIQPPQGYMGTPEPYKMLHHLDENGAFLSKEDEEQYRTVVDILYLLEDENTARNNRAWEEQLAVQTERLTLQKEYMEAGGTEWTLLSLKEVNQQLVRNEWLRTKGLTIESMTASPKGVYFIYSLLQQSMFFGVLILVVALFFFDYLSNEYERKTYLFMSVQPVSKWQRYFRKVKTATWITIGTYLLYLGIGFATGSLLFGSGSLHYPIIVETANTFYPISVGSYILAVASQQLLFIVFIIQILLLLSLMMKNALEVLATFLVLLYLPNILARVIPAVSHIGQWLPFFYMDVTRYLTDGFGFREGIMLGIIVLLLGNLTIFSSEQMGGEEAMMNSIRFEEKKIWKQRKNYVLLAVGLLVIVVLFLFNSYMSIVENKEINQEDSFSEPILGRKEFDSELEQYLTSVNLMIEEQETTFLAAADKGESIEELLTLPTYPFYRTALNNELIDKKLPAYSMRYGTQSSVFAGIVLTGIASILGIIFFLFLFGDSVTKEFEERTMNLCLTQPISRIRLYLLKYSLAVGHSFLLTILFVLIAGLMGLVIAGGSSWLYPVIVFTEKSMTFIPIIQYMVRIFGLFLFVLLFCFALHFLFSTLFRKTIFSLLATIFILAEGHFISVSSSEGLRKIAHLNPFTYLNVGKLFIGYDFREYGQYSIENQEYYANWCLPRTLHNPQIDFTQGLLVLGVATLLLLGIGCYCFRKNIRLDT